MKTRLLIIFVFVLGFVGTAYAYHDEATKDIIHPTYGLSPLSTVQEFEPPLKQMKYTHPTNIVCNENLVLSFKYDLKPVCMDISTIADIQKRSPDYFSPFDITEYQALGSWIKISGYKVFQEPSAFYHYEKPRPLVGTILWQDNETFHEIKYLMINGSPVNIMSMGLLQDPLTRHNWPINFMYTGDENTIIILELSDDIELKNAVGMHMGQFDKQNILFPFINPEDKTHRKIIISDIPDEEGTLFVELAFLRDDSVYEITKIPLPNGEKYLSENSVDLSNIPKISCEIKGGQYKNNQCLVK